MSREALERAKQMKEASIIMRDHGVEWEAGEHRVHLGADGAQNFLGTGISDTVSYHTATSGVGVYLGSGQGGGAAAGDRYTSIENAIGSNHGDDLFGSDGRANVLIGLGGNDNIIGDTGDWLFGDAGRDYIAASATGGRSVFMDGGADADHLVFTPSNGGATIVTGSGNDTVTLNILNANEFLVVLTDFRPFIEAWQGGAHEPTATEAAGGDRLAIKFAPSLDDSLVDLMAYTTHFGDSAYDSDLDADDVFFEFTHPSVNGTIIVEDFMQQLAHLNGQDWVFRVDESFYSQLIPM